MSRDIVLNVRANVVNVGPAMQQVGQAIQQTTNSMKSQISIINSSQGPLKNFDTNLQALPKSMNSISTATQQSTGRLQKFGQMFSDNRGIVFGVAGMTSALAEAVGMMGMFQDTQLRLSEAQDELNKLISEGTRTGKEYTDAQNEVTKQQRFFNMVSRNTILSQMDMVFFTTMVISGLVKLTTEGGAASKVMKTLSGFVSVGKVNLNSFDGALTSMNSTFGKGQVGAKGLSGALQGLGISMKGLLISTGIGIAVAAVAFLIQKWMELKDAAAKAQEEMKKKGEEATSNINALIEMTKGSMITIGDTTRKVGDEFDKSMQKMQKSAQTMAINTGRSLISVTKELAEFNKGILEQQKATLEAERKSINAEMNNPSNNFFPWEVTAKTDRLKEINEEVMDIDASLYVVNGSIKTMDDQLKGVGNSMKLIKVSDAQWRDDVMGTGKGIAAIFASANEASMDFWTRFKTDINSGKATWDQVGLAAQRYINEMVNLGNSNEVVAQTQENINALIGETDKILQKNGESAQTFISTMTGISAQEGMANFFMALNKGAAGSEKVLPKVTELVNKFRQENAANMQSMIDSGSVMEALATFMKGEGYDSAVYAALGALIFGQQQDELNKILKDGTKVQDDYAKKLNESAKALTNVGITATNSIVVNESLKKGYDDVIGSIIEEGRQLRDKHRVLNELNDVTNEGTQSTLNQLEMANKLRLAEAARIPILESSVEGLQARTDATIEGVKAFSDLITGIEKNNIALTQERGLTEQAVNGMFPLIDTTDLLTSELQDLVKLGFDSTNDSITELMRNYVEGTQASKDFFSSITNTDTKKDFGKEWKDLKDMFPKDVRNDVKEYFREWQEGQQHLVKAQTQLNFINASLLTMEESTVDDILHNTFNEFKKIGDPGLTNAMSTYPAVFKDIEKNAKRLPLTFNELTLAMADGRLEAGELAMIMAKYSLESNLADMTTAELAKKLGITKDEAQKLKDDIKKASEETSIFTEEMGKLKATEVTINAIAEMWVVLHDAINKVNLLIATSWATTLQGILKMTGQSIDKGLVPAWEILKDNMNHYTVEIANDWETAMKNILHNTQAASSQSQKEFSSLVKKLNSHFVKIANNWEKAMRNVVQNAKAAASQVNAALAKIKDKTVTITYKKEGSPNAEGGVYNFAEGGVVSAAQGLHTTNGPTRLGPFLYGDNSGGRETVAFLPHNGNKADHIMDLLDQQFDRRKTMTILGSGGDRDIIVPITININGEQYSFTRRYRVRQNQEIASQVF